MVRRDAPLNLVFVPVLLWILSSCSRRDCCLFMELALEESVDGLLLETFACVADDCFDLLAVFLGTPTCGALASPSWQLQKCQSCPNSCNPVLEPAVMTRGFIFAPMIATSRRS